ncbi:hypothetical protein TNCV_525221 [Trichonephila clavipes]|nr:hypothetical protein TNCV_525221 [Trichonephila clavipes]
MPLSRIKKKPLSSSPTSKFYQDMGLRTVLQSGCPKENAYSTPIRYFLNSPRISRYLVIIFACGLDVKVCVLDGKRKDKLNDKKKGRK